MQTAAERILLIGVDWADQLHVAGSPHVEVRLLDQRLCVAGDQLYCGLVRYAIRNNQVKP